MLRLACATGLRHLARMHMTSRVGAEPGSYSAAPVRLDMERPRPAFAQRAVGAVVLLVIVMHVVVNLVTPYEVHRDEFLYMAMGQHLRLWRMDFPPGLALVSLLERGLLGDSLAAIRFLPAVASGAVALVAALVARELGGRRFAQWSAALLAVVSPFALRSGGLFQPVVFDTLWWTLGLYALVRLCADESDAAVRTWWIAYGVACGIGLLFKFSILFFGAATFAALLATRRRRDLLTPWPWVAFLITIALGSPSIVGQIRLGYPVVGQMATLQRTQLVHVGLADFVVAQPMLIGVGLLLGAVLITVASDTLGFLAGSQFGRHALAPDVSPGKTWEGLILGSIGALIVAGAVVGNIHPWTVSHALVLGVVLVIVGPIGDLCESMVKRDLHLKDSGTVLPGHGGVLDRMDALLFALPATYYFAQYLRIH